MEKNEIQASVIMQKDALYVEMDNQGNKLAFSYSVPLAWANGELAGAVDISEDGKIIGIELIGLQAEIENPSSFEE